MATGDNHRIVDAITQVNVAVLGASPTVAMASLYQNLANAQAMAVLNAVHAQQQAWIVHQAATDTAVASLLALIDK